MATSIKALRAKLEELQMYGGQMSNILYNLKQRDTIPERERKIFDELVRQWDAASRRDV